MRSQWIKLSTKLPRNGQKVVVCAGDDYVRGNTLLQGPISLAVYVDKVIEQRKLARFLGKPKIKIKLPTIRRGFYLFRDNDLDIGFLDRTACRRFHKVNEFSHWLPIPNLRLKSPSQAT